ncbi:hypothetical protein MNBD_CHLOROFLEXI01-1561 [hydrothermal vent metagenome]|uniref:DUF5668 domain-containing protein n=1 Tax=hydrothermal vent metagenome TaxID=652676 RepID=A0A3B0UXI9_9ZZZZ
MNKNISTLSGLFLIFLGGLALTFTIISPLFGIDAGLWSMWPLLVVGVGTMLILAPFAERENRVLGTLFIPGFAILVVSGLLLASTLFNWPQSWPLFWPLIVIALAVGCAAAAIWSRNVWLFIPAIILGLNGLVFQFSSLTGWWHLWSILWVIEPLSVSFALIFVSLLTQSQGLRNASMIVTVVSGICISIMTLILSGWATILGAITLIVTGGALLLNNARHHSAYLPKEKSPTKEQLVDFL